jgi:hypothetical protein
MSMGQPRGGEMKLRFIGVGFLLLFTFLAGQAPPAARADAPSGAIFTTVVDGSEINFNHYAAKEDVYLDGGPGPGAPQDAAGLDDGVYVFMVTDPSGKKLLSTDNAECRLFTVSGGIIVDVDPSADGCTHNTGVDIDHGAITVQLFPYDDTPNPGGVYKAWVTNVNDYVCPLGQVECTVRGAKHGFVPADSKTDNFKVEPKAIVEIDTRFFNDLNHDGHKQNNESYIDGLGITWTDTVGGTNKKWSYLNRALDINHEAHVEAIEEGTHVISIGDQAGCTVGLVHLDNVDQKVGPQSVKVSVKSIRNNRTYFIDVACEP